MSNKYNNVTEPKRGMIEYADTFPFHSTTYSYINAHNHLDKNTINKNLKTIERFGNKCVTCNETIVIFRHKECQKCYFINAFVKNNIQYAIYLIYSQTPCFCLDCLDYYGMSSSLQSHYMTKKDVNELQNLFDQKAKEDKFSKQINDLKIEFNRQIKDLKEEVKSYKDQIDNCEEKN
jgi:hypothetical protein